MENLFKIGLFMLILGGVLVVVPLIFGSASDGRATEGGAIISASDSLYYSRDGGVTFEAAVFAETAEVEVHDIAFSEAGKIGVAATNAGIFVSSDGGALWEPLKKSVADFSGMHLQVIAVDEENAYVYIAAYTSDAAYVYFSSDKLATLKKIYESPDGIRAYDIESRGVYAYLGMSDGHILVYDSSRGTFQGFGVVEGSISDIVVRGGVVYAATADAGIYGTFDGGRTWKEVLIDTSRRLPGAMRIRSLESAEQGGSLYAASAVGLLQIPRYGAAWTVLNSVIPEGSPLSGVAVSPSGVIYAVKENVVYKSIDGGHQWSILTPFENGKEIGQIMTGRSGETVYIIVGSPPEPKKTFRLFNIGKGLRSLGR